MTVRGPGGLCMIGNEAIGRAMLPGKAFQRKFPLATRLKQGGNSMIALVRGVIYEFATN